MGEGGIFPAHQLFKKMGDLGLLGIKYPTEYGGMGLDFSYSMVMAEALGDCNCGGVPMAIGVQTDMCTRRWRASAATSCARVPRPGHRGRHGGLHRRERGRRRLGRGRAQDHGASKDGGDYVINGSKMWITNGLQADWCCLLANTGDGRCTRTSR
jgi:citronellyl-CoA dehydrogenase